MIDFAVALKGHLRQGVRLSDLPGFAETRGREQPAHVPAYISARIYDQIETWRRNDQVGGFELLFLDPHAASLMNIWKDADLSRPGDVDEGASAPPPQSSRAPR